MTTPIARRAARTMLAFALAAVLAVPARAESAPPYPPYPASTRPAPPSATYGPPPGAYYPPPPPPPPEPPPLSPEMRILYAPFYAAGLVVRYTFYYGIVAPLEVFSRALAFGVEGGSGSEDSR